MKIKKLTPISKQITSHLIPLIKQDIRCAIIYGSRAHTLDLGNKNSDVDFFFIAKKGANPILITTKILNFFKKVGLTCDYFWCSDDYFENLLMEKIDLSLWFQIFKKGQILYSERTILKKVDSTLKTSSIIESFRTTYPFRKQRSRELFQLLIRNIHRILIDAIWVVYYKEKKLSFWENLPDYSNIIEEAFTKGLITNEIRCIANRLFILKNQIKENKVSINSILKEVYQVNNKVEEFVNKVR